MLSSDDSTGEWALSHTLQFTKQQFPGIYLSSHCYLLLSSLLVLVSPLRFLPSSLSLFISPSSSPFSLRFSFTFSFTPPPPGSPPLPETSVLLGRVESMQWSHDDQTVLAVSWQHGGLSLWSVFGSLLLCSLGDQPGYANHPNSHSVFNPNATVFSLQDTVSS